MSVIHIIELPAFVSSINFRIDESAQVRSTYFDFDLVSLISTQAAKIFYPDGGVTSREITDSVILERRSERLHIAAFDQVTDAVAALALLPNHPEFKIPPNADNHRLAVAFISYCTDHEMVARCNSSDATRREIEQLNHAIRCEREAMAFL